MSYRITVLGAGAWGATLAELLATKKNDVTIWEFNRAQADILRKTRSLGFFPYVKLSKNISVTSDIAAACARKDFIVLAVPSHVLRPVLKQVSSSGADISGARLVSVVKGIENGTLKRISQVITDELPGSAGSIAVLSGPTIAKEIALHKPGAATAASMHISNAVSCQKLFMTPYFRIYTSVDVAGVETGGSLKNVFAIAAGIADGLGMGFNAKAALMSRGLREMAKLGIKMGAKPATLFGLSGLGDLIVTSSSPDSRNRSLGEMIARGKSVAKAEKDLIMVAEGVKTAKSAYMLAKKYKLDLPIISQVHEIIYRKKNPAKALKDLMTREAKPELERIGSVTL